MLDSPWWQRQVYWFFCLSAWGFVWLVWFWFKLHCLFALRYHRAVLYHTIPIDLIPVTKTPIRAKANAALKQSQVTLNTNIGFMYSQSFIFRSPCSFWARKESSLKSCAAYQELERSTGKYKYLFHCISELLACMCQISLQSYSWGSIDILNPIGNKC